MYPLKTEKVNPALQALGDGADWNARLIAKLSKQDGLDYHVGAAIYNHANDGEQEDIRAAIVVKDFSTRDCNKVLVYIKELIAASEIAGLTAEIVAWGNPKRMHGVRIEGPVASHAFADALDKYIVNGKPNNPGVIATDQNIHHVM